MKTNYGITGVLKEAKSGEEIPVMMIDVEKTENYSMKQMWYLILSEQCGLGRGTQKEKVVKWIIDNLDEENRVMVTQRKLAKVLDVSIVTVSETMSILQRGENPFLIRLFSGVYAINPELAYKETGSNKIAFIYRIAEDNEREKELEKEYEPEAEEEEKLEEDENTAVKIVEEEYREDEEQEKC